MSYPNTKPIGVKAIVGIVVGIAVFVVAMAFVMPWYNVWSQEMEAGKSPAQ